MGKQVGAVSMSCGRRESDADPFVSVIVPVYNDPNQLESCLRALEEQSYPRDSYEVIVVDNGSDKSVEPLIAMFPQAIPAYEHRTGSYAARNKGISLSKGKILAFTDSDCIPADNWIEKGVAFLLADPKRAIIGGEVEFYFKDPERPTASELLDSMIHFNMKRYIENERFAGAGNLFTYRKIFNQVGGFDGRLKSSGDKEWGQRATSHGYKPFYAADVVVAHPARYSFSQLREKMIRLVRGFNDMKRKSISSQPRRKFDIDSLRSLFPPLITVFRLGQNLKLDAKSQITVIFICLALQYVKLVETLRMKLMNR